jgi:hypothetical protein
MATTTNYGWTTPDDTALVKDGAAAIRSLGTAVDTTTKNLNPSTTLGDIEYRSSTPNVNTRLPLGTAGQVLKVNSGATAPEWATDATGMTNPMTTTGDTIYSSSGSTPARLGIGTANQQLRVNAGATAPEWFTPVAASSGLTLIERSTFTTTTSIISGAAFSATYDNYLILLNYTTCASDASFDIRLRSGSTTTTAGYYMTRWEVNSNNASGAGSANNAASWGIGSLRPSLGNYVVLNVGNPFATERTYVNTVIYNDFNSGSTVATAQFKSGVLDNATSYDKIDIVNSQNSTGYYAIYGYAK